MLVLVPPDAFDGQGDSRIRNISRSKAGKRFAREDEVAGLTFAEIAAKYGEEAAIEAGVVPDPVTRELTKSSQRRWCTTMDGHRGNRISTRSHECSNLPPRASVQRIWISPFFRLSREDIYLGAERRFSRR